MAVARAKPLTLFWWGVGCGGEGQGGVPAAVSSGGAGAAAAGRRRRAGGGGSVFFPPERERRTHKGPRIGLETVVPMKLNSMVPTNSQIKDTANLRERTLW
jgi:hypothetical protein